MNDFKEFFDKYQIRGIKSSLKHPQTTGKVERVQQSMEYEARDIVYTNTIEELRQTLL